MRLSHIALLVLLVVGAKGGLGQDENKIDYAALLPPIPPKEPDAALKSFRLAKGLKIELVAAEPMIRDPMAIAFDERGRLYVVEFPEYNQRWAEGGLREGDHGRVKLLEDTDGDGKMDQSTVFADDLEFASAVFCWDGGIFVGMAPDILFLKDTTGDGKADQREVVLTGFSREVNRAGQAPLNSFRWGLDNRIHISTNFSGGAITSPKHPDKPPLTVRNRDIVFDPRTGEFEATSGGGQHGMCFDDWGRKFVCRNSEPVKMIFYDDRYLANNPYLSAPAPAVDITEHGKYTKLFPIREEEPWRVLRTRLRAEKKYRGSTEGPGGKVAVSGYFTASTGVTVYRGDALPKKYRGDVFAGEAANNLVYRARLEPDGVGLKAIRATPESEGEFLASTDNWFRPVQLANGPDGALYVVDMYRFLIEGGAFLPPEALKHMDVHGGVDRGRIYRIVPEEKAKDRGPVDLSKLQGAELASLLKHLNGWHRDTAARLIYQRQDRSAIPFLKELVEDQDSPLGRVHARYALKGLNEQGLEVWNGLNDPDPNVRRHSLILGETMAGENELLRSAMISLGKEGAVEVRYQAAWSMGTMGNGGSEKAAALAQMIYWYSENAWMRLAMLSAVGDQAGDVFIRLLEDDSLRKTDSVRGVMTELVAQVGRRGGVEVTAEVAGAIVDSETKGADAFLKTLVVNSDAETRRALFARGSGEIRGILDGMVTKAIATAFDPAAKPTNRVPAVRLLEFADFDVLDKRIAELLKPNQPADVRRTAIGILGRFNEDRIAEVLIEQWPSLGPESRVQALDTLLSRPGWAMACLEAIDAGRIGRGELGPVRARQLAAHSVAEIRKRASVILGKAANSNRAEVIAQYHPALDAEGDFEKGRAVFRKACVACHRLETVGTAIGANLVGIGKSGAESILLNILDPNRDVKPDHLVYSVTTKSGQTHAGMIRSESANGLTLRRLDGSDLQILRVDIERLQGLGISFMPEGLEAQISVEDMGNLLRYLVEVE